MASEHELVIRGGTVADGTGAALREADVAISDGVVTAVGDVGGAGAEEFDARGLLVTPGFVDIHTHYDGQVSWDEELAPSCFHGRSAGFRSALTGMRLPSTTRLSPSVPDAASCAAR